MAALLSGCVGPRAPRVEAPAGQRCREVEVLLRHAARRPWAVSPYAQPLSARYAVDASNNVVLRWTNARREPGYVGSCMGGLPRKAAVWRQPAPFVTTVTPGEHTLFAQHELRLPVGGYPGAYRLRLQAKRRFVARCGLRTVIDAAPHADGGMPNVDRLRVRLRVSQARRRRPSGS